MMFPELSYSKVTGSETIKTHDVAACCKEMSGERRHDEGNIFSRRNSKPAGVRRKIKYSSSKKMRKVLETRSFMTYMHKQITK